MTSDGKNFSTLNHKVLKQKIADVLIAYGAVFTEEQLERATQETEEDLFLATLGNGHHFFIETYNLAMAFSRKDSDAALLAHGAYLRFIILLNPSLKKDIAIVLDAVDVSLKDRLL